MLKNNLLVTLCIIFCFVSCKSPKSLTFGDVTNITDIKLRKNLSDNELNFDKLYLKKVGFSVDTGNEKKSFKGSFVIQNDSLIIASIYALMGIELVRAKFTKDSVIVIDKHNKKVFHTNYEYFTYKFGIELDFSILQSILSNSLFIYPTENEPYSGLRKYKHYVNDNSYSFKSIKDKKFNRKAKKNKNNLIIHEVQILPEVFRISNVYLKDFGTNQTLNIDYQNFSQFDSILFPKVITLEGNRGINNIKITLKINYIEVNDGGSLHFKIPSTYKVSKI
jgi:hypothetical protein